MIGVHLVLDWMSVLAGILVSHSSNLKVLGCVTLSTDTAVLTCPTRLVLSVTPLVVQSSYLDIYELLYDMIGPQTTFG